MSSSSVAVSKKPSSLQARTKKLMSLAFFFSVSVRVTELLVGVRKEVP